ncbi:MAG: hypothetical protein HY074_17050 [Deltaproteobacteria bacterium]|nr:hypothetical protein [Deltaproteobacteria bacterium]
MRRKPLLLALLLLLTAGLASANLKVSLVTVSPGPIIFESFGHTALLVENPDISSDGILYEYGAVNPNKIFSNPDPMAAFNDLFESKVKTNAAKSPTPLTPIDASMRFPLILKYRYLLPQAGSYREVNIDELELTQDQATKFVALVEKDIAAGEYYYDNYKNNCATKVRDRLFDDTVLGQAPRQDLDAKVDTSAQTLVLESIDEAIALNPKHILSLMAPVMERSSKGSQALMMLQVIGIPKQFSSSADFMDSIQKGDVQLQSFMAGEPLAASFHNYFVGTELTEKPIPLSRTLFLPKKLRAALLNVVNPATGKPLIEIAHEIHRTTADEIAMMKARMTPVPSTIPAPAGNGQIGSPGMHHGL